MEVKICAIINPISGTASKLKVPKLIEQMCRNNKWIYSISFTEFQGHATLLAQQAIKDGATHVIAVGGDGTVNEVARALVLTNVILCIIPMGSGNGLARELHIPMDVRRAFEVISKTHETVIDCCKANERIFFCTCGVGFDAAVSKKFADEKHRGSLTYIKSAIDEYLSYKPEQYELQIADQTISEKAFLIACGNASQYGNNAYITPRANIQDGKLDITILSPFTPLDIGQLALQLFTRQLERSNKIKTFSGKEAVIIRQKPGIMHLDGEPIFAEQKIVVSVIPNSLRVIVPEVVSISTEVQGIFDDIANFFPKKMPYIFR